ncbi:MBL fold metallo-hydrolase [Paenibacillus sp. FJAT-26967]|uniref:MBL fold metallo-hydrolase n=1 Tax=Paenibacillus sp. FJAT-26967 TaxID=1729690 RepID=UPI0008396DE6|nr:ribonuclease Z [Paenibacillus sp. FJAT-26967]
MDLILLGTACAASGQERDNTYLLLREASGSTLIDIGGNPLGKLKKLNLSTHDVKRVLFTHFHTDHIYGLPSLLWGMWIDKRTEPFDIYCEATEKQWLESWLSLMRTGEWPVAFEIRIHAFDWQTASTVWEEGDVSLSVFPSLHGVPTVGIRAVCGEKVLVYSADTTPNPLIRGMGPIDVLVHEATTAEQGLRTHSTLSEIADYYDWSGVGQGILVHLSDGEPYEAVMAQLPVSVSSKLTLGQDMAVISID